MVLQKHPHLDSNGPCFAIGLIFLRMMGSLVVSIILVSPLLYVNSSVPFHSPCALHTMVFVGLCFTSAVTLHQNDKTWRLRHRWVQKGNHLHTQQIFPLDSNSEKEAKNNHFVFLEKPQQEQFRDISELESTQVATFIMYWPHSHKLDVSITNKIPGTIALCKCIANFAAPSLVWIFFFKKKEGAH